MDVKLKTMLPEPPHGYRWEVAASKQGFTVQLMMDQGTDGWWGTSYFRNIPLADLGENLDIWRHAIAKAARELLERREKNMRAVPLDPEVLAGSY